MSEPSSSTAHIQRIIAGKIDARTTTWLQKGMLAWLDGKELCAALGLNFGRTRFALLKSVRDANLRAAAETLGIESPSKRAALLDQKIRRFESGLWLRWKHDQNPPATATKLQTHLFYALKTGRNMPKYRQLLRLI